MTQSGSTQPCSHSQRHYRFEARPVAVARGNEKGRVERAIRYIRDNFFAARQWADIDDLNAQADDWCQGVSSDRRCPEDSELSGSRGVYRGTTKITALTRQPL